MSKSSAFEAFCGVGVSALVWSIFNPTSVLINRMTSSEVLWFRIRPAVAVIIIAALYAVVERMLAGGRWRFTCFITVLFGCALLLCIGGLGEFIVAIAA